MIFACAIMSTTAIQNAREVFFIIAKKELVRVGSAMTNACGRMTLPNEFHVE